MSTTAEKALESLQSVIDPEVGLNIVDMGLVYGIELSEGAIEVRMTLTTPGCPMEAYMREEVTRALEPLAEGREVRTEIVWDPPWSPSLIKAGAIEALQNGNGS